jgi:N-acetylmuramoyl-L-alanine amidase CwlA
MYKVEVALLTVNEYSRPGIKIGQPKGLVVHWFANPMSTAMNNRNFWESRKFGTKGFGSAHELINLDGNVVIAIPTNEEAYHVGAESQFYKPAAVKAFGYHPNSYLYGIECAHLDWQGHMTPETYSTLVDRCSMYCKMWKLNPLKDIWRHYDITGKMCHRLFVDNNDAWQKLLQDVNNKMNDKVVVPPANNNENIRIVTATTLNIRKSPSATADKSGAYKQGDRVIVLEKKNGWARTAKGWISEDYIVTIEEYNKRVPYIVTANVLNIREKPLATSAKVGEYKKDEKIIALDTQGSWLKTDKGWVSSTYTKKA